MNTTGWTRTKLGVVCEKVGSGVTPRGGSNVYQKQGISLIRSQNVYDFKFNYDGLVFIGKDQAEKMQNVAVKPEDVLLNITGDSVARCCSVPSDILPARVNQHVSIIRPNQRYLNNNYLEYWLCRSSTKELLISLAYTGGTRKALTKSMIENLEVPVPSIKEQCAIAATLSCLDDKIELNNRINKTLEEMAQTIFKSWFVDFEPFQDGDFEDSELGPIPKGWKVGMLSDIAEITMGQSPRGSSYNEDSHGEVFYQGRADFGPRYPKIRLFTTEPKRLANQGDILLSVRAPVGDINIAGVDCCIGRGLAALKSKYICNSHLFYLLLTLKENFNIYNGEGTVFGSISKGSLHNIKTIVPPESVILNFQDFIGKLDEAYEMNHKQIEVLTDIRDTLLPKLMSGEIRVPIEEV